MSPPITPQELKALQQAEQQAYLLQKDKARAKEYLLRIQVALSRRPIPERKSYDFFKNPNP